MHHRDTEITEFFELKIANPVLLCVLCASVVNEFKRITSHDG